MAESHLSNLRVVTPVRHMTQVELARRWRLSVRTLEKWRSDKVGVKFVKLGGRVIYRLADVEAYEAERERPRSFTPDDRLSRGSGT